MSEAATRTEIVRRRRCDGDRWRPPPADWPEIVRRTWPGLIRHRNTRVPDGWCDIILALADHIEERSVVVIEMFEDITRGKLSCVHTWRRGDPDDDEVNKIIDGYEDLSLSTCRECGLAGVPVRKGTGRLATTRVLCERHEYGDVGV